MTEVSRWLDAEAAADYVSMRETVFLRAVARKKLPAPSYSLGPKTPRWDREAIDARILGASETNSIMADINGLAEKVKNEGRAGRQKKAA